MNPWEKYAEQAAATGPWSKYAAPEAAPLAPEPAPAQAPVEFEWMKMLQAVPGSAGKAAQDMLQPILHPLDTAAAIGKVALGTVQKMIPGVQDSEVYADAVGQFIIDRYGSLDAFKRTAMEDPVGMAFDLSGVIGGVGAALRAPTKAGSIVNRAGQVVQKAGAAIDPFNLATSPVKALAGKVIPRKAASSLYESSAKFPPVSVPRKTRAKIVETALNEGIMPTGRGIDKATAVLSALDSKIDELVKAADAAGVKIDRNRIFDEVKALKQKFSQGADAPRNLRKGGKIVGDLRDMLKQTPPEWLPSEMQKFKTATYRDINWRGKPNAQTETLQTLARGARNAMEDASPEIAAVNRRYGPIAELRDRLPQVANRIDNLNQLPISTPLYGGLGSVVGGPTGAVVGAAVSLLNNPKVAARMGIYLRKLQNNSLFGNFVDNSTIGHAIRQFLLQSGRLPTEEELQ